MKNTQLGIYFFYSFFKRLLLFFIIWMVLTDGNTASLWVGFPFIILSAIMSIIFSPPLYWNFMALMKFIPFYMFHALMGGFDVMSRVFAPTLAINPGLIKHHLYIPKGIQQDMIVNVLNLLPGTLSVDIENDLLLIHVLDISKNIPKEVSLIEDYINDIFYMKIDEKGTTEA